MPISQDEQTPKDIIATKDGIIRTIFVRTGTALVKPGDTVKEGDVLVSSKVSCTNESMEEIDTARHPEEIINIEVDISYDISKSFKNDSTTSGYTK